MTLHELFSSPFQSKGIDGRDAVLDLVKALTVRLQQASAEARPNSVELTRNAKGETQIGVKAYGLTIQEASQAAQAEYDVLRQKYGGQS